jgi:hypothetical protein
LARLAIEQRIGTRLETIRTRVGALDPPAQWADDVCSAVGLDYTKLRAFEVPEGGSVDDLSELEQRVLREFAGQYIGDYVDKLERFVEYYNVQYPSHEGDDTAVLSLREDLLRQTGSCVREAPNVLLYSHDLDRFHEVSENDQTVFAGWQVHACEPGEAKCVRVSSGAALASPAEPPVGGGGLSWLRDELGVLGPGTGGAGGAGGTAGAGGAAGVGGAGGAAEEFPPPPAVHAVFQEVSLAVGTYALSWWDQARSPTGSVLPDPDAPPVEYQVVVQSPGGGSLGSFTGFPHSFTEDAPWSSRNVIEFEVTEPGTYVVAITPSLPGLSFGSLAIANVQLEQLVQSGVGPTNYVATHSSRAFLDQACALTSPADLRAAFERRCDLEGNCFYELKDGFSMSTQALGTRDSRLNGKLAAGNFNFRHVDLSLNVVGTGVRDCAGAPESCFGSGYLQYSIDHEALQTPVLGRGQDVQCFNFGIGKINRGKSLATERFITTPLSSADSSLLDQAGITKTEFRGRPLDGRYRLRIWETPDLGWDRVEDIQIVLHYRFWSQIDTSSGDL